MSEQVCPTCGGSGRVDVFFVLKTDGTSVPHEQWPCDLCNGRGEISDEQANWVKLGDRLRRDRLNRGMTLRRESERRSMTAVELSQMEQGKTKPVFPESQ